MLGNKKPSEIDDTSLLAAYAHCEQLIAQRNEASKHDKFKSMSFPPPNPTFITMMNNIESELRNRKLL